MTHLARGLVALCACALLTVCGSAQEDESTTAVEQSSVGAGEDAEGQDEDETLEGEEAELPPVEVDSSADESEDYDSGEGETGE